MCQCDTDVFSLQSNALWTYMINKGTKITLVIKTEKWSQSASKRLKIKTNHLVTEGMISPYNRLSGTKKTHKINNLRIFDPCTKKRESQAEWRQKKRFCFTSNNKMSWLGAVLFAAMRESTRSGENCTSQLYLVIWEVKSIRFHENTVMIQSYQFSEQTRLGNKEFNQGKFCA